MQQEDIHELITENDHEITNEELLQIEYFPVDDVDDSEIIIHTISNTENRPLWAGGRISPPFFPACRKRRLNGSFWDR